MLTTDQLAELERTAELSLHLASEEQLAALLAEVREHRAKATKATDLIAESYQALGRHMEHWTEQDRELADRLAEWEG